MAGGIFVPIFKKERTLEMKKLFISQPMTRKIVEEILTERRRAVRSAERQLGEPIEVIDSFFQSAPTDAKPLWFLGKSLELLSGADIAYFAKGIYIPIYLYLNRNYGI